MLPDLMQGSKVDFQQHRYDHQPDQNADGNIDPGDFQRANELNGYRDKLPQEYAGGDTEEHPEG